MKCKECGAEPVGSCTKCGGFYCAAHGTGAMCRKCRKAGITVALATFFAVAVLLAVVFVLLK